MTRKTLFLIFVLYSAVVKGQQDSSNYEKLLDHCAKVYLKQSNEYSSVNFFNGLSVMTRYINPYNPLLLSAIKDMEKIWSGENAEGICYKIADSIYTRIRTDHLWDGREADLLKFMPVFKLMNDKMCPCLSSKEIPADNPGAFQQLSIQCDSALIKDFMLMNAIRAEMKKIPQQEFGKIEPLLSRYEYEHCPVFTAYINTSLFAQLEDNLGSHFFMLCYNLPSQVIDIYKSKRLDSLVRVFPEYVKYKNDLEATIKTDVSRVSTMKRTETNKKEMTRTITTTFYKKEKSTTVLGQTICEVSYKDSFKPLVKSFKFIPTNKMTDVNAVLKEIGEEVEMPPPPVEELKPKQKN